MKKLFLTLLFIPVLALASDQYIHPGGLNQPAQRWDYPDVTTMQGDTGFFNQDIGKLAFVPNGVMVGGGSLWRLGDITPTWAWAGGDPLTYIYGTHTFKFEDNGNYPTYLFIKNNDAGASALAGLTLFGQDATATFSVYPPAYAGGGVNVVDGLTITQDRGPIVLNGNGSGNGAIRIADNGTYYSAGLLKVGTNGQVTSDTNWIKSTSGGSHWIYQVDANTPTYLQTKNLNSGALAEAQFMAQSDASDIFIRCLSSGYSPSGIMAAGDTWIDADGRLVIATANTSWPILFSNDAGSTLSGRIDSIKGWQGAITPRVVSQISPLSITPNCDSQDLTKVTALASTLTINAPSGTPQDGQLLKFYIKDNGTTRTLTWNAIYTNSPPTATGAKKNILWFQYNTDTSNWEKVVAQQF
jgi:hypothetical protein